MYEFVTTEMQLFSALDRDKLAADFDALERQATERLRADNLGADQLLIRRIADCRYIGQGYELRAELPAGEITADWQQQAAEAFHQAHEREYVRRFPDSDIQLVNIRVQGVGLIPELQLKEIPTGGSSPDAARIATLDVIFNKDGTPEKLVTNFYDRERLQAGNIITGPAIIEQLDSTTVVNPGLSAAVDRQGILIIACE